MSIPDKLSPAALAAAQAAGRTLREAGVCEVPLTVRRTELPYLFERKRKPPIEVAPQVLWEVIEEDETVFALVVRMGSSLPKAIGISIS
jgi:hypothetical protein